MVLRHERSERAQSKSEASEHETYIGLAKTWNFLYTFLLGTVIYNFMVLVIRVESFESLTEIRLLIVHLVAIESISSS